MRLRWLGGVAIPCVMLLVACSQDIEGLRTPRSPASQSLGIRWHAGVVTSFRWTIASDFSGSGGSARTISGDCDETVLSVDSRHTARLQLTFRIDRQYVTADQTGMLSNNVEVDPRGRISRNPDGNFVDLLDLHTVIPLLPPAGSSIGDRWSEKYVLPNPLIGDTRAFALNGQYVRDDGKGLSRLVVIQVHMLANVDDRVDYAALFGPPPAGSPAHVTIHDTGTQISDITYWYDPVHQDLVKSVAMHDFSVNRDFIDASTGKVITRSQDVGKETVTFNRS